MSSTWGLPAHLSLNWLLAQDDRLRIATATQQAYIAADLGTKAVREARPLAALRMPTDNVERTEGSVRMVIPLIGKVQQAADAFGAEFDGKATQRGAIVKEVTRHTTHSSTRLPQWMRMGPALFFETQKMVAERTVATTHSATPLPI